MVFLRKSFVAALTFAFCRLSVGSAAAAPNGSSAKEWPGAAHATILPTAAPVEGLHYTLGDRGLASLSYKGQPLLESAAKGELRPGSATFRATDGTVAPTAGPTPTAGFDDVAQTITLNYSWGGVSSVYRQTGDRLTLTLKVTNTSEKVLAALRVRLAELKFPVVPSAKTFEAGMFGFGFKGAMQPMGQNPLTADPRSVVPIIQVDYGTGALNFCNDDLSVEVGVPASTNPPARTVYPFQVAFHDIQPGATKDATVSLRFGPTGSAGQLSEDVLRRYAKSYPFRVKWKDRRSIGMIFLASSGIKVPTNPRRWIMNTGKLDVTNNEGKAKFREALLDWADRSIKILKDTNAQGMITWDPEGEEFGGAVYYGAPPLTPILAPEMEFKADQTRSVVDEYFWKFRDAGFRVGVCLRPQQITMVNGKPVQGVADNEHAAQILKEKLAYAQRRWGCTLFYVDSTVGPNLNALDPDVFQKVAEAYPTVLIMPENESMRYFAYTAPLNSYFHHRITSTPVGARAVYPGAFSALMASEGDKPEDHDALVAAVGRGDILLFNCWYHHSGVDRIKAIYQEAAVLGGVR